jgi:ribosomal protein L29
MKITDITKKTDKELAQFIQTSREDLAKAVVESRTKEVRDTKTLGRLKKTIAQALTIERERQIVQEEAK